VLGTWLAQARAELAEADGDPSPEPWAHLVAAWDELGCCFFAAEARYREADALLRAGGGRSTADRSQATGLLAEGRLVAVDLGAEPLRHSIDDLARRARLRLPDDSSPEPPAPTRPEPFGLTARELEVLRLVNEGQSNGEIGAALFISTKTASVHVSNILRKLGAANRIEAAAIGRRHQVLDP
jgi:DNA-binding CsgD family transcriptional regulator